VLGNFKSYPNFNWNEKELQKTYEEYMSISEDYELYSLTNCPRYKPTFIYIIDNVILQEQEGDKIKYEGIEFNKNSNIDTVKITQKGIINNSCVKNHKFLNLLLNNFGALEKIIVSTKRKISFAKIKNPYLYGEVSISRTARYYPANLIFKPLIILGSIFLFYYWRNNLNLFNELKNKKTLIEFSNKFFYFGILSCLFLILHASFLGLNIDSELFKKIRRVIIILFIFFEIMAQISLTRNLYNLKKELKNYINYFILKTKIIFVILIILITFIVFVFLSLGDLSTSTKHILELNYFSILLLYYFLSTILWKKPQKNQKF